MYYYLGNIQGTILHSNIRTKTMESTTIIPNLIEDTTTTTFEDFFITADENVETTITPEYNPQDDEFTHLVNDNIIT